MDNEYNGQPQGFGDEPQKPFTEKSAEGAEALEPREAPAQGAAQSPETPAVEPVSRFEQPYAPEQIGNEYPPRRDAQGAYAFNPERPFAQNPPVQSPQDYTAENDDSRFDPVQRTAMYSNEQGEGGFYPNYSAPRQPEYGYPAQQPAYQGDIRNAYRSYDAPPAPPYAQPQGYGAPQAQPYAQPQSYNAPPAPPYAQSRGYNAPYAPNQQGYGRDPYGQQPYQPKSPKEKTSKGMIAVIIVLSVLLAGSLIGILIYAISSNSADTGKSSSGSAITEREDPENSFTLPEIIQEQTTAPAVHNESDYSDKTDKSYKGIDLAGIPSDAKTNSGYNAEYAFKKASDSVVGVMCYTEKGANPASQGSGIIITEDGYLITNSHVIGDSKTAYIIEIITSDGKSHSAGVVGFDTRTDIAVLKMDDVKGLSAAQFGDSDKLALGDDIIIVGNPGGLNYQNSMSKGIVSAMDRSVSTKNIVKYIQTDAAINPGNSGGPAVNMYGQVVGIASAKIVDEKYEGMGFCIPTRTAKDIIDSLMKNGYVEGRVRIGISGYALTSEEAEMYSLPQGIVVESIVEGGPCDKSGIEEGDVITELDGNEITSFADIYSLLEEHKEGDKIKLKYFHVTDETGTALVKGEDKEVEITLQADK